MLYVWVAAGGAVGATTRHLVNVLVGRIIGHGFPWGTLIVNISGSFIMGLLISLMALKWSASAEMRAFLTTGILGGFTTFSAFSLDFAVVWERGEYWAAIGYVVASVALSLIGVFAGLYLMRTALH